MEETEKINIDDYQEKKAIWALEKDTITRVHHLGADARAWREFASQKPSGGHETEVFNKYIHMTGRQIMQTQMEEEEEDKVADEDIHVRKKRAGRIVRKRVKASDMEDGLVEVLIDREWDTTGWNEDEINAGVEYLVLIFEQNNDDATPEKKERALMMLEKLIFRHKEAKEYMRMNLDVIIGKTANRRLKGGQSASKLDVMNVIKAVASFFMKELSSYNFIGRFSEMALLEARLAATLIQHTFRTMRERMRPRHNLNPAANGFGSDEEMQLLRARALNTRAAELRSKWRSMHWMINMIHGKQDPGVRGPAHVQGKYLHIALDIFMDLLSSTSAGPFAPANRGDLVSSLGTILLVTFMAYGHRSPYAEKSVHIVCCVSRLPDSFFNLVGQDAPAAACSYMKKIRQAGEDLTSELYLNLLKIMQNLAEHAAGVYRGREGYDFHLPATDDMESIDFQHIVEHSPPRITLEVIRRVLASQVILSELKSLIMSVMHYDVMRIVLRTLLALSCSDCYDDVLVKVTEDGATLLIRLVDLIEESDVEVGTLVTCLLMGLAARKKGRDMMLGMKLDLLLRPLMGVPVPPSASKYDEPNPPNYRYSPYMRACAVSLALCRQSEWRLYNPKTLPKLVARHEDLRELMHKSVLYTVKDVPVGSEPSYKQLAIMRTDRDLAVALSRTAYRFDVKQLSDFFCHPDDQKHFYNMDWDKGACVLAILEALSGCHDAAQDMFSEGTVRFCGQCLTLGKFEFLNPNKRLPEGVMVIVFMGVMASCNCMSNLCDTAGVGEGRTPSSAPIILYGSRDAHLVTAAAFFVNTLGQKHPELTKAAKAVHEETGFAALRQLDRFAAMLLTEGEQSRNMEDLLETGKCISYVIRELRVLYGTGSRMVAYLDRLCKIVTLLATPSFGASCALNQWDIVRSLREHLPAPLSGLSERALSKALGQARQIIENVDESKTSSIGASRGRRGNPSGGGGLGATKKFMGAEMEDEGYEKYRVGLGTLTDTFFDCLFQLCQQDQGKDYIITDGFLRRALDKIHLLAPALEGERELSNWAALVRRGKETPHSPERCEMASCLRLLSRCASYHSSKVGAVNDLIDHKFYNTVLITAKLAGSKTCARSDPCFLAAWQLLAKLSTDPARMAKCYRDEDVIGLVRKLLQEVDVEGKQVPDACLESVLGTMRGLCSGLWGDDLATTLPMMRLSLQRVSRLRPHFSKEIVEINFNITKASSSVLAKDVRSFMHTESRFASGMTLEGADSTALDDADMTGDALAEHAWNQILVENNEDDMAMSHSLQVDRVDRDRRHKTMSVSVSMGGMGATAVGTNTFRRQNMITTRDGEDIELSDTPARGYAGYYSSCGVGACGSLRFPGQPCVHCGFVTVTMEQTRKEISKLPIAAAGDMRADVSKLTAREPELQRRMAELKMKHGYMDKRLGHTAPAEMSMGLLGSDGGLGVEQGQGGSASNALKQETSVYTYGTYSSLDEGSLDSVSHDGFGGIGGSASVSHISGGAGGSAGGGGYERFPGASPPASSAGSRISKFFDEDDSKAASSSSLASAPVSVDTRASAPRQVIPTVVTEEPSPVSKKSTSLFSPMSKRTGGKPGRSSAAAGSGKGGKGGMLSPVRTRAIDVEDLPELRSTRPPPRPSRK